MNYQEYAPPNDLAHHIRCVWWLREDEAIGIPKAIYPDGCCELIVHRATPFTAYHPGTGWRLQSKALFAAQQRGAVWLKAIAPVDCIGVRLTPAMSACLAGKQLPNFRDQVCDLCTISEGVATALLASSVSLDEPSDFSGLYSVLRKFVLPYSVDPRIEKAVKMLEEEQGRLRIAKVAEMVGMSPRAFQTRFLTDVGLSAKEFSRVLRLQFAIRLLDGEGMRLLEALLISGFSDQAHATRELNRMIGVTPARLLAAFRGNQEAEESIRLATAFLRGKKLKA